MVLFVIGYNNNTVQPSSKTSKMPVYMLDEKSRIEQDSFLKICRRATVAPESCDCMKCFFKTIREIETVSQNCPAVP